MAINVIAQNKTNFEIFLYSTNRKGIDKVIKYLNDTDFFIAPASTRFHGAREGGLLEHSLTVYQQIKELANLCPIKMNTASLIIAALLHDVCKADFYKLDTRNVKIDGIWKQVPMYTIDDKMPIGHARNKGRRAC